jgi:hypothetical protein
MFSDKCLYSYNKSKTGLKDKSSLTESKVTTVICSRTNKNGGGGGGGGTSCSVNDDEKKKTDVSNRDIDDKRYDNLQDTRQTVSHWQILARWYSK